MKTERYILKKIMDLDPDFSDVRQSADAYRNFHEWVIETYGEIAWHDYTHTNWDANSLE